MLPFYPAGTKPAKPSSTAKEMAPEPPSLDPVVDAMIAAAAVEAEEAVARKEAKKKEGGSGAKPKKSKKAKSSPRPHLTPKTAKPKKFSPGSSRGPTFASKKSPASQHQELRKLQGWEKTPPHIEVADPTLTDPLGLEQINASLHPRHYLKEQAARLAKERKEFEREKAIMKQKYTSAAVATPS